MVGDPNRALRPFWMHQIVEYIIGVVLISVAFQSPTPAIPAAAGMVVMLNPAITKGPAGAFSLINRNVHRVIDLIVIGVVFAAAAQPVVSVEGSTRILIALLGVVLGFVWWHTDFATRPERKERRAKAARPSSEELGRSAGRTVGKGVNAARRFKDRVTPTDDDST